MDEYEYRYTKRKDVSSPVTVFQAEAENDNELEEEYLNCLSPEEQEELKKDLEACRSSLEDILDTLQEVETEYIETTGLDIEETIETALVDDEGFEVLEAARVSPALAKMIREHAKPSKRKPKKHSSKARTPKKEFRRTETESASDIEFTDDIIQAAYNSLGMFDQIQLRPHYPSTRLSWNTILERINHMTYTTDETKLRTNIENVLCHEYGFNRLVAEDISPNIIRLYNKIVEIAEHEEPKKIPNALDPELISTAFNQLDERDREKITNIIKAYHANVFILVNDLYAMIDVFDGYDENIETIKNLLATEHNWKSTRYVEIAAPILLTLIDSLNELG